MRARVQGVAAGAALAALVLLVGTTAFLAARAEPAAVTTTTTSTTSTTIGADAAAEAIAASLRQDLTVAITGEEATCVADGLVALVPPATLVQLADRPQPLTGVPPEVREELVQLVIGCLPEASAAALLGSGTTTSTVAGLPDEG
ncbi:MAG: hypothetical protein ACLGI8_08520 [Acidimicrobiia bacterium]